METIDPLIISWVIPPPFPGSGGHRNIFRTVRWLSNFGYQLKIYVMPNSQFTSSAHVEQFIHSHYGPTGAHIILGIEDIAPCDALFATHWSTADAVRRQQGKSKELFYFVQDYEPLFHPLNSLDYRLAEETYHFGFHLITSGPWCAHLLREKYGLEADFFLFPIDKSIYYPVISKKKSEHHRIIFFARPEMPRRCYPLGVDTLKILYQSMPQAEIVLFGSDQINLAQLPFPAKNLGVVKELSQLADLYRSADLGIAFSTTNPSLVPYEMMACGCPVVVNNNNNAQLNYGSSENVLLVPSNSSMIAREIINLLKSEKKQRQFIRNGLEFIRKLPSEEEMVRRIEGFILKRFDFLCRCSHKMDLCTISKQKK